MRSLQRLPGSREGICPDCYQRSLGYARSTVMYRRGEMRGVTFTDLYDPLAATGGDSKMIKLSQNACIHISS